MSGSSCSKILKALFCCCYKDERQLLPSDAFDLEDKSVPYEYNADAKRDAVALTYSHINGIDRTGPGKVYATQLYGVYNHLYKINSSSGDLPLEKSGWKIHVSIHDEDIEKAWNIVAPLLIEHGVHQAKVTNGSANTQPGKQIVIYQFDSHPDMDWPRLLQRIEEQLIAAGVRTADNPKHRVGRELTKINEPQIEGSRFFYCENDTHSLAQIQKGPGRGPFERITINATRAETDLSVGIVNRLMT
jgi:hypothetical protein